MAALTQDPVLLEIDSLSKSFSGVQALKSVDIDLRVGEVHALVGHNGSGKSTLIKCLAGFYHPDPGSKLKWKGTNVGFGSHESTGDASIPLRFVHQNLGLINEMNAIDNFALQRGYGKKKRAGINWASERRRAEEFVAPFGVKLDLSTPLQQLTQVQRTIVAIAIALRDWRAGEGILVLDEPTAVLPMGESKRLFETIRRIRAAGGTVLYVSHRLAEVFDLADRVTVLRNGRRVATEAAENLNRNDLINLMSGSEEVSVLEHRTPCSSTDEMAMEVEGLSGRTLKNVSFGVRRGEILGVAGLPDDGRDELMDLLIAARPYSVSGRVRFPKVKNRWTELNRWTRDEVMVVPGDRAREGVISAMTVQENLTLATLSSLGRRGWLPPEVERRSAARLAAAVELTGATLATRMDQLSGGNQQKVVIGRALAVEPSLLIMSEPTAGVDIGTRLKLYRLIKESARKGLAVLIASTDADDLLAMCSRVLIVRDGKIADEVVDADIHERSLLRAMEGIVSE